MATQCRTCRKTCGLHGFPWRNSCTPLQPSSPSRVLARAAFAAHVSGLALKEHVEPDIFGSPFCHVLCVAKPFAAFLIQCHACQLRSFFKLARAFHLDSRGAGNAIVKTLGCTLFTTTPRRWCASQNAIQALQRLTPKAQLNTYFHNVFKMCGAHRVCRVQTHNANAAESNA